MGKLIGGLLLVAILVAGAIYTGFADPLIKRQVQSALMESGTSEKRAECMADRMVDRLTIFQLIELRQGMAAREGESEQPDGLGDTIKRLRRGTDTETVAVVSSSAALCAIGIG